MRLRASSMESVFSASCSSSSSSSSSSMAIPPEGLEILPEELDSYMFLEDARKTSEEIVAANPLDIHHLTRWAAALFHLSLFQNNVIDSKMMLKESIEKLEKVVSIKPKKQEALWFLGSAHTAYGFLTPEFDIADTYFDKASQCSLNVLVEDPTNDLFLKALETNAKIRELHTEILNHGLADFAQQEAGGGSSTSLNAKGTNKKDNSDLKYDIFKWAVLGGIVAWVGLANHWIGNPWRHSKGMLGYGQSKRPKSSRPD